MRKVAPWLAIIVGISCWPAWGQPKGKPQNQQQPSDSKTTQSQSDQRGTKDFPFFVHVLQDPQSKANTTKAEKDQKNKSFYDALTAWGAVVAAFFTGLLVIIGWRGVNAANRTLRAVEKQAALMETQIQDARTSNENSAKDVQASIAEAVRSAKAMEGVAESMAINADSVKDSVSISREIATTQKLAIELQGRPYLSVFLDRGFFQDKNHVFEITAVIRNHGNTPAYDVVFRAKADILPFPIPEDFDYPLLDDSAGASVSLMPPGTNKLVTRSLSDRVSDGEVEGIKRGGPPKALGIWGRVEYRDAFDKMRYVKFAFTVHWQPWIPGMERDKDGMLRDEPMFSRDTPRHNEAN